MSQYVITLSRQFGSGGSEIAKALSKVYNIPYYDKSIMAKAADESGIHKSYFEKADEKRTNSFLYSLVNASYGGNGQALDLDKVITDDKLFLHTAETIRALSSSPCIIVGRCADDILADKKIIKLYIHADFQDRVKRISMLYQINEKAAITLIKRTDKTRENYYNFYTSKSWGDVSNYDLAVNSSHLGVDDTVKVIKNYVDLYNNYI